MYSLDYTSRYIIIAIQLYSYTAIQLYSYTAIQRDTSDLMYRRHPYRDGSRQTKVPVVVISFPLSIPFHIVTRMAARARTGPLTPAGDRSGRRDGFP